MDSLPEEVLTVVLSNLNQSDLKCARLINRKFYNASLAPSIISRETLVFNPKWVDPFDYGVDRVLPNGDRKYYNFRFANCRISRKLETIITDEAAPFIRSLKFVCCKVLNRSHFWRCLKKCVNLEVLELKTLDCSALLKSFNNPSTLYSWLSLKMFIANTCTSTDTVLDLAAKIAPNATNLWVNDVEYSRLHLFPRLHIRAVSVRRMELSHRLCCDYYLKLIARVDFLHLETIILNECEQTTDEGLMALVENLRTLRVIEVELGNDCVVTNESLLKISACLPNLQTLIIRQCGYITFEGINSIMICTSVSHLSIMHTNKDMTEGTTDAIVENCDLEKLSLVRLPLSLKQVAYIAMKLPRLRHLNLSCAGDVITNNVLQLICRHLPKLTILDMKQSDRIDDNGFAANPVTGKTFCESLKDLTELYLESCNNITDVTIKKYLKLPYLRRLNLRDCELLISEISQKDKHTGRQKWIACEKSASIVKFNLKSRWINYIDSKIQEKQERGSPKHLFIATLLRDTDFIKNSCKTTEILEKSHHDIRPALILNYNRITVAGFLVLPDNVPCLDALDMRGVSVNCNQLMDTLVLMPRLRKLIIDIEANTRSEMLRLLRDEEILTSLFVSTHLLHAAEISSVLFIRSWQCEMFVESPMHITVYNEIDNH